MFCAGGRIERAIRTEASKTAMECVPVDCVTRMCRRFGCQFVYHSTVSPRIIGLSDKLTLDAHIHYIFIRFTIITSRFFLVAPFLGYVCRRYSFESLRIIATHCITRTPTSDNTKKKTKSERIRNLVCGFGN